MREGWTELRLSEAFQIKPPKAEARRTLNGTDLVSFVPMNDLPKSNKFFAAAQEKPLDKVMGSYTYFADNDVLLAKITPCFENGKLGIARNLTNGVGFGSSEYIVFRSTGIIFPEFLYYFLSQDIFRNAGKRVMSGAVGHKRVPKDFIENHLIPTPPLPEQKRIVAILDEAFEGIATATANAEKNLKNARELFESYLNAVFTQKGEGWVTKKLSDLTTVITDGDHSPPPKSSFGIPFITISNINKTTNEIDFSDTFKVPKDYFDQLKPNKKPKIGDILYTVTGSYGIPVMVRDNRDFCFQRHIGLIRPKSQIDSSWLYYLLMSPLVFKQANSGATGTAQKTVSLGVLRNIVVPEIPLSEQQNAVAQLTALSAETQRLETIYQQKLTALSELKQSLLQKAFSGELTAESASTIKEKALA